MGPTIAVLGTLTRDTTVYADGTRTENLGGLLYTLSALAHLFAGRACILPVANVGFDLDAEARAALALPGVDLRLLRRVDVPNNHVYLTYRDAESRDEVLQGLVPPVDVEHCMQAAGADHVLVNLTSGRDIQLGTLEAFRSVFAGTLQLDVHSLTLGLAAGGRRVLERPPAWQRWVACADWVQLNETEATLLGDGEAPAQFACRLLELGPCIALVTLGARGCLAAWRRAGDIETLRLQAEHHPEPGYPTGCGDVFGAAFAYARLTGASVRSAVRLANGVASTKACLEPHAEIARIRLHAAAHLGRWLPQDA